VSPHIHRDQYKGELNNADLHTKKLRDKSFAKKADNILGSPANLNTSDSEAENDTVSPAAYHRKRQ
jgi:hypothetical protein